MSRTVTRLEIFFSGRVQGVGFRYATFQVAKEFEVNGEVKNLADGRVQLVAEGTAKEVNAFADEVKERMSPFIRKTEDMTSSGEPGYKNFSITQ
ncbi:acylphosphatase [Rubellicoccus peritrichatus]|uniref:acylphosphatase n=1 Tax=Rubellicoccus peritrichatus TaxID=3080537 RepID=A0AAQ3LBD0_9BACT|nr:acylphosphatase [Puniceicoccus sp. CR14]WOO41197.1 acylphosphatase [Puniceicoccus sp. CR14]